MSFRFIILLSACLFCFNLVHGQSKKREKNKERTSRNNNQQPTSLDPYFPQFEYAPKNKVKSRGITYDAEKKYYARKEQVAKERRKAEKESMKPQYSDPSYFGHKKKPKKNKPGKMKYCKECGIRH